MNKHTKVKEFMENHNHSFAKKTKNPENSFVFDLLGNLKKRGGPWGPGGAWRHAAKGGSRLCRLIVRSVFLRQMIMCACLYGVHVFTRV